MTDDPVQHLANLAGIELTDEERELLRPRLAALQSLIDALPAVDGQRDELLAGPVPLRGDVPCEALGGSAMEALMASAREGWLDVPPVREDEP